jgi:5'-nucleotidase
MHRRLVAIAVLLLATTLALATAPASAGDKKGQKPFRILVTNDDGVTGAGTDALVEGLRKVRGGKVTVIAPAENKSGTGSQTTPGTLTVSETTLASGYPAIAVAGFPADSVAYALDQGGLKQPPNLVISGINQGQNLGTIADEVSGTVGAAKAAAARGVPALAASQGLLEGGDPDYASGVKEVLRWLKQHRKTLSKKPADVEVLLDNLNIPTCATGAKNRGVADVPLAPEGTEGVIAPQDCASTLEDPPDDIVGFNNGFVTLTELPVPTG